jgi:hypothetical protein
VGLSGNRVPSVGPVCGAGAGVGASVPSAVGVPVPNATGAGVGGSGVSVKVAIGVRVGGGGVIRTAGVLGKQANIVMINRLTRANHRCVIVHRNLA